MEAEHMPENVTPSGLREQEVEEDESGNTVPAFLSPGPSPWDCAAHIQGGFFFFSHVDQSWRTSSNRLKHLWLHWQAQILGRFFYLLFFFFFFHSFFLMKKIWAGRYKLQWRLKKGCWCVLSFIPEARNMLWTMSQVQILAVLSFVPEVSTRQVERALSNPFSCSLDVEVKYPCGSMCWKLVHWSADPARLSTR